MMMRTTTLLAALTGITLGLANPAPAPAPTPSAPPSPTITPAPLLLPQHAAPALAPRRLGNLASCARALLSLARSAPIPPAELLPWLLTEAGDLAHMVTAPSDIDASLTTLCDAVMTPPASLRSTYSSYTSEARSWLASAAPDALGGAGECDVLVSAQVALLIVTDGESCTSAVMEAVRAVGGGDDGDEGDGNATATASTAATVTAEQQTGTTTAAETSGAGDDGTIDDGVGEDGASDDEAGSDEDGADVATTNSPTGGAPGPRQTGFVAAVVAVAAGVVGAVAAL